MKNTIFVKETNFNKLKNIINENKDNKIIFSSNDDDLNRKVLEKLPINMLLINQKDNKDFQKQRGSGFNHVFAKIAKKNKINIGINFDEIINSKGKQKAEIIARVIQNIKLCNKDKLKMHFISENHKRDVHDLRALGLVFGMPTWMTKCL
ncbi:MAG: RNase P subunit p30 family protein [archaeon]